MENIKIKPTTKTLVTLIIIHSCLINIVSTRVRMYVSSNAATEKGQSAQITCDLGLTPETWTYNVDISKAPTASSSRRTLITTCYKHACLPSQSGRYTMAGDGYSLYVNITKLKRSEDEMFWTCEYSNQVAPQMFLTVYTSPNAALLTSTFDNSHSLSDSPVSMTCKTDRCSYKDPIFKWYIIFENGSRHMFDQGDTTSWDSNDSCDDSELVYYSKLSLRKNMALPDNADMNVYFVCGISFPTFEDELITSPSSNLSFAIQITSVKIYDGDQETSDNSTITVTENVPYSVTCKAGPSRPPPIYLFYMGAQVIKESENETLTFIPDRHKHGDKIYGGAYNLQEPANAVLSKKPNLFVNIPVSKAILRDGNEELGKCSFINVSEGIFKTLSCITDASRPFPTIAWYIDNNVMQNDTGNIFTFVPEMDDHSEIIYCAAYNVPGFQPVESLKPQLHVTGRPLPPLTVLFTGSHGQNATFYWIAGYNGGYTQSFQLQYRKVGERYWVNKTHVAEILNQDAKSSLPEYTAQISNMAPGEYQARLIAQNVHGETSSVNVKGFIFHIASAESDTAQSSSQVIITGTIMGCVILVLVGIIIYQFVSIKRKQMKSSATTEIKLEDIPDTSIQTPSAYEELKSMEQVSGSTYDALETPETKVNSTRLYENTTIQ